MGRRSSESSPPRFEAQISAGRLVLWRLRADPVPFVIFPYLGGDPAGPSAYADENVISKYSGGPEQERLSPGACGIMLDRLKLLRFSISVQARPIEGLRYFDFSSTNDRQRLRVSKGFSAIQLISKCELRLMIYSHICTSSLRFDLHAA